MAKYKDDDHYGGRPAADQTGGLGLFAIQVDPPSVPIASSERGADEVKKKGTHITQNALILLALWRANCIIGNGRFLSRDDIIAAFANEGNVLTINAACGRLGPSGGLVTTKEMHDRDVEIQTPVVSVEDVCVSASNLKVTGYALTRAGARRCESYSSRTNL